MKKWLAGIGVIAVALILTLCFVWHDASDQVLEKPNQEAKVQKSAKPKNARKEAKVARKEQSKEDARADAAPQSIDDATKTDVSKVVASANVSKADGEIRTVTKNSTSAGVTKPSSPAKDSNTNKNWPAPAKSRFSGKTLAYRSVELPPNEKGGKPGELREWLIEPDEGYTAHVEEEYRPDENGEMQLVAMNQYAANQVILTLDGEVSFEAFKAQMAQKGAIVKTPLMELEKGAKIVAVLTPDISFDSVENLRLDIKEYLPQVKVSCDVIETINRTPNDARYSSQWGLTKIQAPSAWDIRTDASSVVIAVIDTGVNYNHADLAGNMWVRSTSASATNFKYGMKCISGSITGNPLDDNGHGSHCAGIIGAVGDNATGVSGVAWKAKIMACKSLSSSGSGSVSDRIICMEWARTNGASIVSMSLGAKRSPITEELSAFQHLRSSGIIAVCAAGNDGDNNELYPHYPASYDLDNIVSVAASTSSDGLASFSCYGSTSVDIAAPGEGILSTVGVASYGQYESWSGTSMATPFVSGALALLKTQYPSYTYQQLIQKLYAGGDSISALSGKVSTGKRLNVYKALRPDGELVSPVPTASKGTYSDRVYVSWPSVSGASYYRVFRANSSSSSDAQPLGSWQTGTSYNDYNVTVGTTYYYWVCAAKSSSGANQSAFGSYSTGYLTPRGDSWDPGDDTPSGGTSITPTASRSTHGTHTLSGTDKYDFFKISMTAGTRYTFETTGTMDTYGELFNSTSTNSSNRVTYDDDGGTNLNFRIAYTPSSSGTYYLRVRAYSVGSSGSYTLAYQRSGLRDSWDPGDDTPSGGTSLTPTTTVQTHGTHTLSADDRYDFFRISMTAGRKYVFESTGSSDVYGELFNSTSTNASNRVAYNDDSGENLNFKFEYTPTTSQTYYLRVRKYSVGSEGSYSLKYSYEQSVAYDIGFCNYLSSTWPAPFVITSSTNTPMAQTTSFTTNQSVWVCFQGEEVNDLDLTGPITNCCKIVNNATGATRYTLQVIYGQLSSGRIMLNQTEIRGLEAGSYTATMELNKDANGNRKIIETTYTNNTRSISFTVMNPQKTLSSIAISGNASIASKAFADYRCRGTYSDGSLADVSPTWSITSGSSYASVSSSGRVTAGDTTVDRTIVLKAEFGGKSATKSITIRGYAPVIDPEDDYDPFGPIVSYPRAPMIVEGVLYINNVLATANDMIAAYSGNEVRAIASTDSNGRFTMGVNVAEANERITFKAYDASEGDNGTVFNCLQSLLGSSDPQGTASSPIRFDALPSDPFGQVVREALVPPTIIEASVTIDGEAASSGDILAVFSGNTIVGKASVVYDNQNGHASATCSVVMFFSGRKTLSFKLWDADEEEILESSTTLTLNSGDVAGTTASPREIAFSLDVPVPCPVSLRTGWNLVSFSALPDSPTPANVFSEVSSSIQYVCDVQGNLWSPSSSNSGLSTIRLGEGYWVRSLASSVVSWNVEGRGNPDTEIRLAQGWNLVGYTLPRAGQIPNVLRTALASGKVQYITDQNGSVYPGGALTSMQPGVGYWVRATGAYTMKFDSAGMETASVSLDIMSNDSVGDHPFGTPITRVGMPTIFDGVSVSLFGKPAAYGDYLAVFDRSTDELLAVQQVNTEDGTLMFTIMGLGRNDKLYFKVWNSASGLNSPAIFAASQSNDLTISNPENPVVGLSVAITGTKPTYTVTYDLDGKATRTGGGALSQSIAFGGNATDPTISVQAGWRFVDWDYSKRTDIRCNMTITALYEEDDTPPATYTVTYRPGTNGTGAQQTATKTQDVALTLAGAIFTRTGFTQTGWATSDGGSKAYDLSASYTANAAITLYPFWTANPSSAPENDEYANAAPISGESGTVTGTTVGATAGESEFLNGLFGSEHTIWYRWVAPKSGIVRFDTVGSSFDTTLGALEEVGGGGATSVASNDDERSGVTTSAISFRVTGGTGYMISVGGYRTASGAVRLNWEYQVPVCVATFDANGGKPAKQTVRQNFGAAWGSVQTPVRSGYMFGGWWTEKTGGERVDLGEPCGFATNLTLYARWLKACKVTVKDGTVTDGAITPVSSFTVVSGTPLIIEAADKSSRGMVFSKWTYAPNTVDLGSGFLVRNGRANVVMPEKDVTFTANYITKPGYVTVNTYEVNNTANENGTPQGVEWSDDGKAWTPVGDGNAYPVKTGKSVAIQLRCTDPRWTVPAKVNCQVVEGRTHTLRVPATRVPVVTAIVDPQDGAVGDVTLNPKNGQVLSGKPVSLTAKAGKQSVFAYWTISHYDEDGELELDEFAYSPTAKLTPVRDVVVEAVFRRAADVPEPTLDTGDIIESANSMVGVEFSMDMGIPLDSRPVKFSAKGLPQGLKIDANSGVIYGVPTKAGRSVVTVTATSGANAKMSSSLAVPIVVKPLPLWAQGQFSGLAFGYSANDDDVGNATMSVTAAGKITGKVVIQGTNWTFSAASYSADSYTDEEGEEMFAVDAEMKAGKLVRHVYFYVEPSIQPEQYANHPELNTPLLGAEAWGWTDDSSDYGMDFSMYRNVWKDKTTETTAKAILADWEGVYTVSLRSWDESEYGHGYLSVTVDKSGNVKATGKLADGTSVSMTSPLVFTYERYDEEEEAEECFRAILIASPTAYKGGVFFLPLTFAGRGASLNNEDLSVVWQNRDPMATGDYGSGFWRGVDVRAHYYDKLQKLEWYYNTLRFNVNPDASPMLEYTYRDTYVGTNGRKTTSTFQDFAFATDLSNQEGLTFGVNAKGTDFAVEKATKPVQNKTTKEWMYNGPNDGGLTITFTQATGIVKGSYTFWYDYESAYDSTTDKETLSHTSKKVNFEGIVVDGEDDLAGFFLWDATGVYNDPKTGKEKTYKYKLSYPVLFQEP